MALLKGDQFFQLDPAQPPKAGTTIKPLKLAIGDTNGNHVISPGSGDTIGGLKVTAVWLNDTVTVDMGNGPVKITGVTFYREGGPAVFTPTDGTVLGQGVIKSCSYVTKSTQVTIQSFGPPCFAQGTLIATPQGGMPVDRLRAGDLVVTRDHGPQALRWVGSRRVAGQGRFAPIRFAPGALGNIRPLMVSPQHRMLISGWQAEMYFGEPEVLVAAKSLINGDTIVATPVAGVDYFHLLFDSHEIVYAEGIAAESLYPGEAIMTGDPALRAEVLALFPELASDGNVWPHAAPVISGRDGLVFGAGFTSRPARHLSASA